MSNPVFQKIIQNVKDAFWVPDMDDDAKAEEGGAKTPDPLSKIKEAIGSIVESQKGVEERIRGLEDVENWVKEKVKGLEKQAQEAAKALTGVANMSERLEDISHSLEKVKTEAQTALEELRKQFFNRDEAMEAIKKEISSLDKQIKGLPTPKNYDGPIEALLKRVEALEGATSSLKEELAADIRERTEGVRSDLQAELDTKMKTLLEKIEAIEKAGTALKDQVSKLLSEQMERLREELAPKEYDTEISALKERIKALEEDGARFKEEVGNFLKKQEEQVQELSGFGARMKGAMEQMEKLLEGLSSYESEFKKIKNSHKKLRDQVNEYHHFIEGILLDKLREKLVNILKKDLSLDEIGPMEKEKVQAADGKAFEFDLVCRARRNGSELLVTGAFIKQLKKKDLTDFLKKVEKIKANQDQVVVPLVVANQAPAQVKKFAAKQDVRLYFLADLF